MARTTKAMFPASPIKPANGLKRKVGYDEEITSSREKLNRMDIEDATGRSKNGDQEGLD